MKTKTITIYNDCENYNLEDEIRNYLFENFAVENNWTCKEDIPYEDIYRGISSQNEADWQCLAGMLGSLFDEDCYIMTGFCGRWCGDYARGTFIKSFDDFEQMIRHLDNIKVTDLNGHLIVEGYHHDGYDRYEIKRLTRKGYELANNKHFAHDRQLHSKIMSCNLFSALPHLARRMGIVEE